MSEEQFIVAFELGSSKLTAVAGQKLPDGSIKVLASEQESSTSFIRKGAVYNVDLMTARLKEIKERMEGRLQQRIDKAYVAIGGMGMHTVSHRIARQFGEEQAIKQELIDGILETNGSVSYTDREIIDVVPLEYKLGTIMQANPIGVVAENIEGNFLNIIVRSSWRKQIEKCFEEAGIRIVELRTIAQVKAGYLLTEDESRSGCVIVDMGAQTTTVAVYKNKILRHLAALPLGGDNLTTDISSFNIKQEEAEELKLLHATAVSSEKEDSNPTDCVVLKDGRKVAKSDFNNVVWSRVEEILRNVGNQIKQSKYSIDQLPGGLIITGDAARLKKMEQALREFIAIDKLRFVKSLAFNVKADKGDLFGGKAIDESYNVVLAIVSEGETNCSGGFFSEEPEPEVEIATEDTTEDENTLTEKEKKESKWNRTFRIWKEKLGDMVSDD